LSGHTDHGPIQFADPRPAVLFDQIPALLSSFPKAVANTCSISVPASKATPLTTDPPRHCVTGIGDCSFSESRKHFPDISGNPGNEANSVSTNFFFHPATDPAAHEQFDQEFGQAACPREPWQH